MYKLAKVRGEKTYTVRLVAKSVYDLNTFEDDNF